MSHYDASKWEAEWTAAGTPKGPIVHVQVKLADASREGRARVAGCGPQPVKQGTSTCSLSQGRPPMASRPPAGRIESPGRLPPAAAQKRAEERAEAEQRQAINRFRPFIQVAAVSAAPKSKSPDPFGLRRLLAWDSAPGIPREDPRPKTQARDPRRGSR